MKKQTKASLPQLQEVESLDKDTSGGRPYQHKQLSQTCKARIKNTEFVANLTEKRERDSCTKKSPRTQKRVKTNDRTGTQNQHLGKYIQNDQNKFKGSFQNKGLKNKLNESEHEYQN